MITLDIIMPDLDGWSVLKALKADPELCDIPVVLVTIMRDRDLGFALGAADYLTKPFDREVLMRVVGRHRRRRRSGAGAGRGRRPEDRGTCCGARCRRRAGTVAEAANGREALDALERATPALVLLDLMMPEMDGFEVLERLRREETLARRPGDHRDRQGPDPRGCRAAEWPRGQGAAEGRLPATGPGPRHSSHDCAAGRPQLTPSWVRGSAVPRLLYVEDNEMNRDMLSRRFRSARGSA